MNRMTLTLLSLALAAALPAAAQQREHGEHSTEQRRETPPASEPVDHSTMDHSGMDHSGMDHSAHGAQALPRTPIPPITDADREGAKPPAHPHHHGHSVNWMLVVDHLEAWDADGSTGLGWDVQGWLGTDEHRAWLRSAGEREGGHTEAADVELLYGRPVSPWWDLVAGVRQETRPGPSRTWAAFGVMGMAPYKFEVEATAYVGEGGRVAAGMEAEYDVLLTNRLILQPVVELSWHGQDDTARGIASGFDSVEAGLRLRYEFTRRFAPYIGVVHERALGDTADLRRAEGEHVEDTRVVAGVRVWF
jgi:copper resistance protein B